MLSNIIAAFLFIIPLWVWNGYGDGVRTPKEFLSILAMMCISGYLIYSNRLKCFKNRWLLLFWGWCFVTTLFSIHSIPVYLQKVIVDTPAIMFAWKELFYITLATLTIYTLASCEEKIDLRKISKVISIAVFIISVYSIYQMIGLDEFFRVCEKNADGVVTLASHPLESRPGALAFRIVGTLGNPKILVTWLVMCLSFLFYAKNKLGYISAVLVCVLTIINNSATGLLGIGIMLFIYLLIKHKKILLTLMIISAMLIPISIKYDLPNKIFSPRGRIEVHKEAFNILKEKSITGMGLGTFEYLVGGNPDIIGRLKNNSWKELHNDVGQVWFSTGIIGLMLFVMFMANTVKRFFMNITDESIVLFTSLAAFMAMSFFYFLMRVAPASIYACVFTGILLNKIGDRV